MNWRRHLLGIGLGVAFLLMLGVVAMLHQSLLIIRQEQLAGLRSPDGLGWLLAAVASLQVVVGLLLASAMLGARRLPWLPTVPGVILMYLAFEGPLRHRFRDSLPDLWGLVLTEPFAQQNRAAAGVMAGALLAAAIWGWVSPQKEPRHN